MRPEEDAEDPRPGRSWKTMLQDRFGTSSKSHQSLLGRTGCVKIRIVPGAPGSPGLAGFLMGGQARQEVSESLAPLLKL